MGRDPPPAFIVGLDCYRKDKAFVSLPFSHQRERNREGERERERLGERERERGMGWESMGLGWLLLALKEWQKITGREWTGEGAAWGAVVVGVMSYDKEFFWQRSF